MQGWFGGGFGGAGVSIGEWACACTCASASASDSLARELSRGASCAVPLGGDSLAFCGGSEGGGEVDWVDVGAECTAAVPDTDNHSR